MTLYGVNKMAVLVAIFIRYTLLYAIGAALTTLFMFLPTPRGGLINYTSPTLFYVLVLVYSISCITFVSAVSAFFRTGNNTLIVQRIEQKHNFFDIYMCGGGGIVCNHVWVTVVACTCMLSCTPHKVIA